ncbi:MAG: TetR-like C-terminal domain-containing protein, partial [Clostridia bacterium]
KELKRTLMHMALEFVYDKKNHVANVLHNNRNEKVIHTINDSLSQSIRYQFNKFKDTHPSKVPAHISAVCLSGALVSLAVWCIDNPDRHSREELAGYLDAMVDENII